MVKACSRCKKILDTSEFNWKFKNIKLASNCKQCSREYIREHYNKNPKYYIEKAKRRNQRIRNAEFLYIYEYLKIHPCVDCGEADIMVLEFDHRNRKLKTNSVSIIMRRRLKLKKLMEEIAKCEVRCANCHRRKTAIESNSWRLFFAPVG